jgi:lipopolysaccharide/colanic/teichoic acid biosynthesis glycosyltransferase
MFDVCGKRLLNMCAAAIALLALSPVVLVVMVGNSAESRGPLFLQILFWTAATLILHRPVAVHRESDA